MRRNKGKEESVNYIKIKILILSMKKRQEKEIILKEIKKLNKKLNLISSEEGRIEKVEKKIEKEEREIKSKEIKMEQVLFQMGKFAFKRRHFLEVIRGVAGAFLGVGLGKILLNQEMLANALSWVNIIGIIIFILFISGLLIYKNEKEYVKTKGYGLIVRRLLFLYFVCILVELVSLWLFNAIPGNFAILVKVLIIGSYAAMASAVSFTVI